MYIWSPFLRYCLHTLVKLALGATTIFTLLLHPFLYVAFTLRFLRSSWDSISFRSNSSNYFFVFSIYLFSVVTIVDFIYWCWWLDEKIFFMIAKGLSDFIVFFIFHLCSIWTAMILWRCFKWKLSRAFSSFIDSLQVLEF